MSYSNENLNTMISGGNTGTITSFPKIGIPTAILLAPKGTVIPAASLVDQATLQAYINGKLINDTRSGRWFFFNALDKFTDETKKTASEDTGRYQFDIYSFPNKFSFRMMKNAGNMGNYIEATTFSDTQANYDIFILDDLGGLWNTGDETGAGGAQAFELQQFYIPNWNPRTVTSGNQFMLNIQLGSQYQFNGGFKVVQANYDSENMQGLQNAVLTDVSTTLAAVSGYTSTTDIIFTVKAGQDSWDVVNNYMASLTAGCFVAYNLTTGAAATISSITKGQIVVAGQLYYWVKARLSGAPTSGNMVYISTAAPSVVTAAIPGLYIVTESIYPTQNGNRYAVKTFS